MVGKPIKVGFRVVRCSASSGEYAATDASADRARGRHGYGTSISDAAAERFNLSYSPTLKWPRVYALLVDPRSAGVVPRRLSVPLSASIRATDLSSCSAEWRQYVSSDSAVNYGTRSTHSKAWKTSVSFDLARV